jgi:predicted ATPase
MPSYILTGAPGSGKTALLRLLERAGQRVVEEAATDVIALEQALGDPEPWARPDFASKIVALQRARQLGRPRSAGTVFFDRSPVCTLALSRFLGRPVPTSLAVELDRLAAGPVYEPAVFFVRNLGFVTRTAARRISFADSLEFEKMHEQTYSELGFELIEVPAGPLAARAALVLGTAGERAARRERVRWRRSR